MVASGAGEEPVVTTEFSSEGISDSPCCCGRVVILSYNSIPIMPMRMSVNTIQGTEDFLVEGTGGSCGVSGRGEAGIVCGCGVAVSIWLVFQNCVCDARM